MKRSRGIIIISLILICFTSGTISMGSYISRKQSESEYETLRQAVSITESTTEMITEELPPVTSIEETTVRAIAVATEETIVDPAENVSELPALGQESTSYQASPGLMELMSSNDAVKGWIKIDGTRIDYPIMQNTEDNEYYLHRDINGKYKKHGPGSIYLDSNHNINDTGLHVIYGHNMKNGTMFKDVTKFTDAAYFKQHQSAVIYTGEREIRVSPVYCYAGPEDGSYRGVYNSPEELERFLYSKTGQKISGNIFVLITCSYGADGTANERTYCILREDV